MAAAAVVVGVGGVDFHGFRALVAGFANWEDLNKEEVMRKPFDERC